MKDWNIDICDDNIVHRNTVDEIRSKMPADEALQKTAEIFKVMSDPTRTKIIWVLKHSEMCVCDLAELLGMSSSAVSHQLSTLRSARLVKYRRDGKEVFYSLDDDHVCKVLEAGYLHTLE